MLPQPSVAADRAPSPGSSSSFSQRVRDALQETNRLLVDADRAAQGVANGTTDGVEAVLALSRAEVALRHVVAMSSRALEAYREVLRLQL